jgi:hypothetical protein
MRRYIGIGVAVLVAVGAAVGLVAGSGRGPVAKDAGGGTAQSSLSTGRSATAAGAGATAAKSAPSEAGDLARPTTVPALPTRVVKHARLELRVRGGALDARLRTARDAAEAAGGYVEQSDQTRTTATLTLRVPVAGYAAVLDRIEHLGRATGRSEQGDDVTAQYTDLDARLRNLRAQEAVLLDLMRQAKSIPDSITVQQQLSGVQEQIEQLTGQQRVLDGQTTYATIAVTLRTGAAPLAPADEGSTLGSAWSDAVGVMLAVVGGIVIVLGALAPIGLLGALGLAGWIAVRRRRPRVGTLDA